MLKYGNGYKADKGKQFVLRTVPKKGEHTRLSVYEEGYIFKEYVPCHYVDDGFVVEEDIPGWTGLKGYQVVYDQGNKKIPVGSAQIFPIYKAAASYKKYYESCPWFNNALFIEDVIYEGVPLSKSKVYNDNEHYFGLDACEVGDYFTEDMVDGFMNVLPPACMRSDCSQIGEPVSDKMDKDGKYKPTYTTFKKVDKGIWERRLFQRRKCNARLYKSLEIETRVLSERRKILWYKQLKYLVKRWILSMICLIFQEMKSIRNMDTSETKQLFILPSSQMELKQILSW